MELLHWGCRWTFQAEGSQVWRVGVETKLDSLGNKGWDGWDSQERGRRGGDSTCSQGLGGPGENVLPTDEMQAWSWEDPDLTQVVTGCR